jgi:hypothetical protein
MADVTSTGTIDVILDWLREHRGERVLTRMTVDPALGVPPEHVSSGRIGPAEPWTDVRLGHLEARYQLLGLDGGNPCAPVVYDGPIIDVTGFRLGVRQKWGEQWLFAFEHDDRLDLDEFYDDPDEMHAEIRDTLRAADMLAVAEGHPDVARDGLAAMLRIERLVVHHVRYSAMMLRRQPLLAGSVANGLDRLADMLDPPLPDDSEEVAW